MPQDSAPEPEPDDSDAEPEFVEVSAFGRYGRYKEVLGKGAFKKVYRAFDQWEGIEVAWNQVRVADLFGDYLDMERLCSEVHLLKTLKHKNIIKFYNSWVDTKNENINFITEIFTSGNLRQYRKKHKHVELRALTKWSRQILEGLLYLHSLDPPVIHRDLKCDNIFINGNQGQVKIGDLGLAGILQRAHSAHSVLGTPEFMAPEFYQEEYNELVDIYAFGMCLLELVTLEYPYAECSNPAQIYRKVSNGVKPASLKKVKDPKVLAFIEKCIANVSERLSAKELLMDPFLQSDEDSLCKSRSVQSLYADDNGSPSHNDDASQDFVPDAGCDFTVQGQRKDQYIIFLKLRIEDSSGHVRNIHFPFDVGVDTPTDVASEMVEELNLTDHDVSVIAEMIDSEIHSHIPDWAPREEISDNNNLEDELNIESVDSENLGIASPLATGSPQCSHLNLETLPSGRRYWSDLPKASGGNGPSNLGKDANASPLRQVEYNPNLGNCEDYESVEPLQQVDGCRENVMPRTFFEVDGVEKLSGSGYSTLEQNENPSDSAQGKIEYVVEKLKHSWVGDYCSKDVSTMVHVPPEENAEQRANVIRCEIKTIVEKLGLLMNEQQRELDDIRKKHEQAVSDLLKEYPREIRDEVLRSLNQNLRREEHIERSCVPRYKVILKDDEEAESCLNLRSLIVSENVQI